MTVPEKENGSTRNITKPNNCYLENNHRQINENRDSFMWLSQQAELMVLQSTVSHSPPRWPSGKASASRAADLGSIPALAVDLIPGRVTPVAKTLELQRLPCLAFGSIGSALGLIGPVSVYSDGMR